MAILDELLPDFDVHELHAVEVALAPEQALRRALAVPVAADRLVWSLLRLRALRPRGTLGDALFRGPFELLAETPVEIVAGFSGRPWRPGGAVAPFAAAGPGDVRVAVDLRAEPTAAGARLSTETRVAAVDAAARRAFRRYWLAVGPFSALIRRRWLAAVAR